MFTKRFRIACSLLVTLGVSLAGTVSAESDAELLAGVNSTHYNERLDSLKIIERSLVENQKIYQILETRLLEGYQTQLTNMKHLDEMSWTCKALASSADDRYQQILQTVTDSTQSTKLRHHCSSALERYPYYQKRQEVLAKPQLPGLSGEASKYIHLISSENSEMMRSGIRMLMTSGISEELAFDKVRDVLLARYNSSTDSRYIDSLAWLCKGLASSGNQKYVQTLREVEKNATSIKLQGHARRSLAELE